MSLIALTLTIAGVTLHRDVAAVAFDFGGRRESAQFTDTNGALMLCTATPPRRVVWQFGPATITADKCQPDRIFRGAFQ